MSAFVIILDIFEGEKVCNGLHACKKVAINKEKKIILLHLYAFMFGWIKFDRWPQKTFSGLIQRNEDYYLNILIKKDQEK